MLPDPTNNVSIDTSNLDFNINIDDSISCVYAADSIGDSVYADTWPHAETLNINIPDDYPTAFTTLSDNDDSIAHHVTTPGIQKDSASPTDSIRSNVWTLLLSEV